MNRHGAPRKRDIWQEETEERKTHPTLTEDFLEASAKEYHRQVTRYQIDVVMRYNKLREEVLMWEEREIERGAHEKQTQFTTMHHLTKIRRALRDELDGHKEHALLEKEQRDAAILAFAALHGQS